MLYLTCFVAVFLLSGPMILEWLGKSPGERCLFKGQLPTHLSNEPQERCGEDRTPAQRKSNGGLTRAAELALGGKVAQG